MNSSYGWPGSNDYKGIVRPDPEGFWFIFRSYDTLTYYERDERGKSYEHKWHIPINGDGDWGMTCMSKDRKTLVTGDDEG